MSAVLEVDSERVVPKDGRSLQADTADPWAQSPRQAHQEGSAAAAQGRRCFQILRILSFQVKAKAPILHMRSLPVLGSLLKFLFKR